MSEPMRCEIATSTDGRVSVVGNVTPPTHPSANATAIRDGYVVSDAVCDAMQETRMALIHAEVVKQAGRVGDPDFARELQRAAFTAALTALREQAQAPQRDWPEDFSHENGNYSNRCGDCGQHFVGHKRRITCKHCATAWKEPG